MTSSARGGTSKARFAKALNAFAHARAQPTELFARALDQARERQA